MLPRTSRPAPGRVGLLGENALANRRISLVRFSSAFSLRSRFSSSVVLAGQPVISLTTVGLVLTYPLAERLGADPQLPGHIGDRAALEDRYKSIARALKSGANLLGLVTISSSLGPIRPRSRASRKAGEPHFTPTSSSWLNQVERWFGLLTERQLRRGVHDNVTTLERDIQLLDRALEQPTPNPSSGPRPPTKSSNDSPDIYNEFLAGDTS